MSPAELRVMVYPRDPNPYQDQLYGELERLGVDHRYIGEVTGSHTLNLLLLPFEVAMLRRRGYSALHLHWVYRFTSPVGGDRHAVRLTMRWYFVGLLDWCRLLGVGVVWTAHNVVPHLQVFDDDARARRQLTARCSAVIAHNRDTLEELAAMGCSMVRSVVIPHGPPDPKFLNLRHVVGRPDELRVVFVGRVEEYKGVEDLIDALATLEVPPSMRCLIAGACDDPVLAERLRAGAGSARVPVELALGHLSDDELGRVLGAADVVVLPYRRATSSGAVLTALGAGCPVIIPRLSAFADVPEECAWRYDGSLSGLADALWSAALTPERRRLEMSDAAAAFGGARSWTESAKATLEVLSESSLPGGASGTDGRPPRAGGRLRRVPRGALEVVPNPDDPLEPGRIVVAVDVRYLQRPDVGIASYLARTLREIDAAAVWRLALLTDTGAHAEQLRVAFGDAEVTVLPGRSGFWWEQSRVLGYLQRRKPDVFIAPSNWGVPLFYLGNTRLVVIVHDLIPLRMPTLYLLPRPKWALKYLASSAIAAIRADWVIANSDATADEVRALWRRQRVTTVYPPGVFSSSLSTRSVRSKIASLCSKICTACVRVRRGSSSAIFRISGIHC